MSIAALFLVPQHFSTHVQECIRCGGTTNMVHNSIAIQSQPQQLRKFVIEFPL